MNPLITKLGTTINQENAMTTDTANDRREGYCDGMSRKFQQGRNAAYVAGNWDGWQDGARLAGMKPTSPVTIWQRVINWLRHALS